MPGSYIEVGGIRYDVPVAGEPIRILDSDGAELFSISVNGTAVYLNPNSASLRIPEGTALRIEGLLNAYGLATNVGQFGGAESSLNVTGSFTWTTLDDGAFFLSGLPIADPEVAGQVWSNNGVLTVSSGE